MQHKHWLDQKYQNLSQINEVQDSRLEKTMQASKDDRPHNPKKAILLIMGSIFCLSLTFLTSKFIYQRNSDIQPCQLLFARGVISTLFSIMITNKDLKYVIWDGIPKEQFKNLAVRSFQATCLILIQFTIVKYLSLIYIGLA